MRNWFQSPYILLDGIGVNLRLKSFINVAFSRVSISLAPPLLRGGQEIDQSPRNDSGDARGIWQEAID